MPDSEGMVALIGDQTDVPTVEAALVFITASVSATTSFHATPQSISSSIASEILSVTDFTIDTVGEAYQFSRHFTTGV